VPLPKRLAPLLVGLAAVACTATRPAPSGGSGLSGAARDWSELPDFARLRAEYGERGDFSELCERDRPLNDAFGSLNRKNWSDALEVSTRVLGSCAVDIDFHFVRFVALQELGRTAEAEAHRRWLQGLVDSVLQTGDGRSSETPWTVIWVAEEYAVIRALGMRPRGQQSLLMTPRGPVDAVVVEEDGAERTLYFDTAVSFRRMERLFESK